MKPFEPARKLISAGALILDAIGRVLIVKPTYKDGWEIPGGIVEAAESPLAACRRELCEELGIDVSVGRPLCVEYRSAGAIDSLQWVFDGGMLSPDQIAQVALPPHELSAYEFVPIGDLAGLLPEVLVVRLQVAHKARERGTTAYIENGLVVAPND